jgi:hypothetical protein
MTRQSAFRWWAAVWSTLVGFTFLAVTVLTLAVWFAEPGSTETNPVVDLSFFALGAIVAVGLASQFSRAEQRIAGLQQAGIGIFSLGVAGAIGRRIEPAVGSIGLALVVVVLVVLHPAPRAMLSRGAAADGALLALSSLAAVPAIAYAIHMLRLAVAAGPSCFFGQCAHGDRLAEAAAAAIAIVAVSGLAALRTPGWRLALWSAGLAAILVGAGSVVLEDVLGSFGPVWGSVAVVWGGVLIAIGELRARRQPAPGETRLPRAIRTG